MPSDLVELPNVVSYVVERTGENDLDAIAQAMDRRRSDLQETTATAVTVGATVSIGEVFPVYLTGLSGVVKAITPGLVQYVTLALDRVSMNKLAASSKVYAHLADRASYDLPGVPLSSCRVTNT